MSAVQPSEQQSLMAIWKAAASLKTSSIPVLRNYATHVFVETSTVLDQLMLPPPATE